MPSALASADLLSQLKDVQLLTATLVSESDTNLAAQDKDKLVASKAKLEECVAYQLKQSTGKIQEGLAQQVQDGLTYYFNAIDETVRFKLDGKGDLAGASYSANVVVYQRELQQIVDTLRIEKSRTKDEAIAALNSNLAKTSVSISIATIITIIALSGFGFLLYRQITSPISQMQSMMSEIASS